MKIKSKRVIRMVVCLILSTMVLACSFSVFSAYEEESSDETTFTDWYYQYADQVGAEDVDAAWEALGIYGIWATMNSMGISISVDGVTQWRDEIYYEMQELLNEYLATIPSMNYLKWIIPWAFGFTETGLFQGNNTMLDDVSDFVYWLKTRYNLSDNSSHTLSAFTYIPVVNEDGVEVYIYPYAVYPPTVSGWKQDVFGIYTSGFLIGSIYQLESGYYFQIRADGNYYHYYISSNPNMSSPLVDTLVAGTSYVNATYQTPYVSGRGMNWNGTSRIPVLYQPIGNGNLSRNYHFIFYASCLRDGTGDTSMVGQAMDATTFETYFLPQNLSTTVDSGTIVLPSDDSSYTPGDMFVVDNGDIVYLSVDFPESISIDNLPAIIQPNTIDNPEIDQFYDFIPSFIEEVGDSMNFFKQIIFRMPDEVLYCVYAVLSVGVIFGFLRMLREH